MARASESPGTFADITADVPDDVPDSADALALRGPGWRIEVLGAGAKYIWRRGSHQKRVSAPGGPFVELTDERQQQYETNRQRYHATRAMD